MEHEESYFTHLFLSLYEIWQFCEGHAVVDTKELFNNAKIAEETYSKLKSIGAFDQFESKFSLFCSSKGLKCISIEFFKTVSHTVLAKYITESKFSDIEVKSAIEHFLIFHSDCEFVTVIKRLNHSNHSLEILNKAINISENTYEYNAIVCLEEFTNKLINNDGNVESLYSIISDMITENKGNVKLLLKLLCLAVDFELCMYIQELIALYLNTFLGDIENIHFCSVLLEETEDFHNVLSKWHFFGETLVKLIKYSLEKLQCCYSNNSYSWIYNGTDKIIQFDDITTLVTKLVSSPVSANQLKVVFNELSQNGFGLICEDLLRICQIK